MKFAAAIIALASVAAAAPNYSPPPCTPATYACLPNANGWQVCNTSGQFVFAGNCPPKTVCKFDKANDSPYCVPPDFHFP